MVVTASERSAKLSMTMHTSVVPRFLISVSSDNQILAKARGFTREHVQKAPHEVSSVGQGAGVNVVGEVGDDRLMAQSSIPLGLTTKRLHRCRSIGHGAS